MASMNTSMVQDYIKQNYPGLQNDNDFVQTILSQTNGDSSKIDAAITSSPQYQKQQATTAQTAYQGALNTAVGGLQTQKTNLGQQYSDLLKTVTEEYQPIINQTTATTGAEEAKRGISPDSTLFQQQTQGALQPIYGAEAGNAQTIGAGSIADTNALTGAISNLQAGGAGTASQLPLQYGSLALSQQALPSQIAANTAQTNQANALATASKYLPAAGGVSFFNTSNQTVSNPALQILKQLGYNLTG